MTNVQSIYAAAHEADPECRPCCTGDEALLNLNLAACVRRLVEDYGCTIDYHRGRKLYRVEHNGVKIAREYTLDEAVVAAVVALAEEVDDG